MAIDRYDLKSDGDHVTFVFTSVGPKGEIIKVVQYSEMLLENMYNLGFGDWDPWEGSVDDKVVSNNGDTEKLLNTVAYTVLEFTKAHPNAMIYVTGSTKVRTRVYRIGISRNLALIGKDFDVEGLVDEDNWVPFKEGVNYDAFLIKRKKA